MTVGWRKVGTGFSQRERPVLPENPEPADVRDLLAMVATDNTFEGWISEAEAASRLLLGDIDPADAAARFGANHPQTVKFEGLGMVLRLTQLVKHEINEGRADRAARYAVELGHRIRELELSDWEGAADTGVKVREGAARGGRLAGGNDGRDRLLAEAFRTQKEASTGNISDSERMAVIGRAHGLGRSASIAAIKRGLKILSSEPAKPNG